jgi:hypothetical protein
MTEPKTIEETKARTGNLLRAGAMKQYTPEEAIQNVRNAWIDLLEAIAKEPPFKWFFALSTDGQILTMQLMAALWLVIFTIGVLSELLHP